MENAYDAAKEYALRLLGMRDYTAKLLFEKLCRRVDEENAQRVVERMQELGLQNDADYAVRCARDLVRLKHYALRRVVQELQRRGIGQEEIEAALAEFREDDPREAIVQILWRKYALFEEDEKIKTRARNALLRLGYRYADVGYVLEHAEEYTQEQVNFDL